MSTNTRYTSGGYFFHRPTYESVESEYNYIIIIIPPFTQRLLPLALQREQPAYIRPPSTSSTVMHSFNNSTWVDICGSYGNRYQMFLPDGSVGYISKDSVSLNSPDAMLYPDTTMDISIKKGQSYTTKIDSATTVRNFYLGSNGLFTTSMTNQGACHQLKPHNCYGDTFLCKLTATGTVGQKAGIFIQYAGKTKKLFAATIR